MIARKRVNRSKPRVKQEIGSSARKMTGSRGVMKSWATTYFEWRMSSSPFQESYLVIETEKLKNHFRKTPSISSTMFVAGKYVPPHMRTRPAGLEAVPARAPGCPEPKRRNFTKKITKPKPVQVEAPAVEEPKVKPHCELFLADLPAPMRSVTTLAGKRIRDFSNVLFFGLKINNLSSDQSHHFADWRLVEPKSCIII